MHIVDEVQDIYVQTCQPVKHYVILVHNLIIVKILGGDGSKLGSNLHGLSCLVLVFLVLAAVDSVKQSFCKVCTRTEELDLLTCLGSGYAAADAVVITPDGLHNIIVLILDRRCLN